MRRDKAGLPPRAALPEGPAPRARGRMAEIAGRRCEMGPTPQARVPALQSNMNTSQGGPTRGWGEQGASP
ncbi:hypothetical protein SAMN06272775_6053 [Streptomyces sp. 2323.1]|nr:hypothetical protein SAMN06272775_6053 [Streptomyces sp. 2323.1]